MATTVPLTCEATLPEARSQTASRDTHGFTSILVVENLHCGNCLRTVERTLAAVPGVTSARVNLSTRRASIVTDRVPPTLDPFVEALASKGFPARAFVETTTTDRSEGRDTLLKPLGVAGFAAANIMLLSVAVWSGHAHDMSPSLQTMFHWLSAMIALPAVAFAGRPFFASARRALAAGRLNMDVPISLGVLLATAMSLFQTIRGSEQVYFDAAVMLLFFLLAGRALDQAMRSRAESAAQNLLGRRAVSASRVRGDGSLERVAVVDIVIGDRLLIAAGEQFPVDGRIVRGSASVDESILTGESRPRHLTAGDRVHGGSVALSGPVEIEASAGAEQSLLADIARLIEIAEQNKSRYVRLADRAARLYAPLVHLLGAVTFAGWMWVGAGWEAALTAAIAVLIITCPCALALAVPAVQVVATSQLFRKGIVLKAADGLERLAEIDTVVFDKTGTLTLGRPDVSDETRIGNADLALAAGLAAHSRHPYSQAVVRAAERREVAPAQRLDVTEHAGSGLSATGAGVAPGQSVRLGSAAHCGATIQDQDDKSVWYRHGERAPIPIVMEDGIRPDAGEVVQRLRKQGYDVEILSGDAEAVVEEVARETGIERWAGRQTPERKIARLSELASEGHKVLMVGDGLNDAPALASGHASLSPASAIDISQIAADGVFQGERLEAVLHALSVARAARRCSLENFAIAIGYNVLFVPLAMAGMVTPLIAAVAMSASSIAVTMNALRLNRAEISS